MEDFKIDTICPHSDFCGGCIHQGVPYEKQLSEKEKEVRRLLEANQVMPDRIDPIEGCPSRYGYRNKMEYKIGRAHV